MEKNTNKEHFGSQRPEHPLQKLLQSPYKEKTKVKTQLWSSHPKCNTYIFKWKSIWLKTPKKPNTINKSAIQQFNLQDKKNAPMQEPRTRIIRLEPDRHIIAQPADANRIPHHRIDIIIVCAIFAPDNMERML